MAVLHSALQATKQPHVHAVGEECPYCEQPIPNDRLEEVRKRIQSKDRERQAEFEAKAKADLEALRQQNQQAMEAFRKDAATREAAALAQGRQQAEEALKAQLAQAAEAATAANERREALEGELVRLKDALTTTVSKMTAEFAEKEQAARAEARTAAVQELNAKVTEAEAAKLAAEKKAADMQASHDEAMKAAIADVRRTMEMAKTDAVQELSAKITEAEAAKLAAEKKAAELQASKDEAVRAAIAEVREAMEKAKTDAVNAERSKNFEEKLKLEAVVEELKRKLQNQTAEELGDGAEIDLFEVLKAEFPHDDIQRVGKGKSGADIIHKVRHNGAVCGCIVYDSKNHQQWRTDHVAKLRQDQLAEKAEHAVLSTHAFPKGKRELHIDSGVIVAKPGRAVVIAMLLRKQVVQLHCLKVSNEERSRKTDELYALMTSDRFEQFISTITKTAEQLDALQQQERKAHDSVWRKQGELFRTIVRQCAQFDEEVARIVGTAE